MRYFGPFTLTQTQTLSAGFFRCSRPLSVRDPADVTVFTFTWLEKDGEGMWQVNGETLNVHAGVKQQIQADDSDIDAIYGDLITPEEKLDIKDKILNSTHLTLEDVITSSAEILSREKDHQWLLDNGWIIEDGDI